MSKKSIDSVIAPPQPHFVGDGFRVHNFFPSAPGMDLRRMDPFLLMDYNSKYEFPPTDRPKGVGVHPHRGFETVTIAYQGKIEHRDSSGGGGVISKGGVQWMTAASGVLHKEFHETEWSKKGGDFQMVQLWVNLPGINKMDEPKYQAIDNDSMVHIDLPEDAGKVELVAGENAGHIGPAKTFSPINMMNARLNENGKAEFEFPVDYNTALLMIEGKCTVDDEVLVPTDHLAVFKNDGERFTISADEESTVLILSGKPLNEPIAAQGPFVMNTDEEIAQAIKDFQEGKFGELR